MSKKNPSLSAEEFESSCAATLEQSQPRPTEASKKTKRRRARDKAILDRCEESAIHALTLPTSCGKHAQQSEPREGTQLATVLELLRSRPGQFVGVNEIMRVAHCAATHSTVSTLRQRYSFNIENRMERAPGGVMLSEYRLKEEAK
jgi:hypothetical protein